jgi:hypothetical protein
MFARYKVAFDREREVDDVGGRKKRKEREPADQRKATT